MKKLKKILLINWLYFSKEIIDVGDVNFLTGKNGAGKSTVIDALQIVLLGETNAKNFNQAANEKSQRTLDGYLRADMDENSPCSRRGKDFSTYIACEFQDDVEGTSFVTGVVFDCRSDGSRQERFFIYVGTLPDNCFVENGEAMEISTLRRFLKQNYNKAEIYDTQKEYRRNMLSRWNVHNEQVLRMMKKAVSFRPIVDIQKFITENICDIPDKPDIEAMQQNIRDYKRHELLAQQQEDKLAALQDIRKLYRDMNQATDRWRIQSFLVQWAHKEMLKGRIDRNEREKQDCIDNLDAAENTIESLAAQIKQKEDRMRELELACAQSSVFQEEDKLYNQKERLLDEQQKLMRTLQNLALEIKKDAEGWNRLWDSLREYDDPFLASVQEKADAVQQAYAPFQSGNYEMFAMPITPFECAQQTASALSDAIRNARHNAENQIAELKEQMDQKDAALASLRKNIKDYPNRLRQLQKQLVSELEQKTGCSVKVDILADVLELKDERWRDAVEGYLNTQKFYLLVEPEYYATALSIFNEIKAEYSAASFGLIDIGKLRERENISSQENSLARKIQTENKLARSYVDYLLGRVVCCDSVQKLRNYKTAITADGMLYQGYVARRIQRKWMENAFIGRHAVSLRINKLEGELHQIRGALNHWNSIYQLIKKEREPLFTQYFVQTTVAQEQIDYLRGLEITEEITEIDKKLSELDLLWLTEQRKSIEALKEEISRLNKDKDQKADEKGQLKERIRQFDYVVLPDNYQQLTVAEDRLKDEFSDEYQQIVGVPRYQLELERLKRPDVVYKNFNNRLGQSMHEQEAAQKKLFATRREYAVRFKSCPFVVESMDNDEYDAER